MRHEYLINTPWMVLARHVQKKQRPAAFRVVVAATCGILAALTCAAPGVAQEPPAEAPQTPKERIESTAPLPPLEELLERALEHNPDIAMARADAHRAEAALRKAQAETLRQVSIHYREVEMIRNRLAEVRTRATLQEQSELTFRLAEAQGRLEYLVGDSIDASRSRMPGMGVLGRRTGPPPGEPGFLLQRTPFPPAPPALSEEMSRPEISPDDAARLKLDTPASIAFDNERLENILDFLNEYLGVNLVADPESANRTVTINMRETPLRETLLAISDIAGVVFMIRDYGIFATTPQRAQTMNAPSIPSEVPLVSHEGSRAMDVRRILRRIGPDGRVSVEMDGVPGDGDAPRP